MNTKHFIDKWNQGNQNERAQMVAELDLLNNHVQVLKTVNRNQSVYFVAFPALRAGIWWMGTPAGRILMEAFRVYPNGLQTFNSFRKVSHGEKWPEAIKTDFVHAFNGIVSPEFFDN